MSDIINHPDHYKSDTGLETIDVIEAFTPDDPLLANVLKYVCRHKSKNGLEDLKKAQWYLNRRIENYREPEYNKFLAGSEVEDWRVFPVGSVFRDVDGDRYVRIDHPDFGVQYFEDSSWSRSPYKLAVQSRTEDYAPYTYEGPQ